MVTGLMKLITRRGRLLITRQERVPATRREHDPLAPCSATRGARSRSRSHRPGSSSGCRRSAATSTTTMPPAGTCSSWLAGSGPAKLASRTKEGSGWIGRAGQPSNVSGLRTDPVRAFSRCRAASAKCRRLRNCQAAATAIRHVVVIATARSARCVWAEMRWRWTLKVL